MSILIKGMEMPTSCLRGGCPMGGSSCSLWEEKYWNFPDGPYLRRHPKCPLVPVPPHGRLIDADALLEHMRKIHDKWKMEGHYTPTTDDEIMIMNMPTVIEAEE